MNRSCRCTAVVLFLHGMLTLPYACAAGDVESPRAGSPTPQFLQSYTELPEYLHQRARRAQKTWVTSLWKGEGHIMAGRLVLLPGDRYVGTRAGLEPDGGFAVAVYPTRSLAFWAHGYEPLTLETPAHTNACIAWYGDVRMTPLLANELAEVTGVVYADDEQSPSSDESITIWCEIQSPGPIFRDGGAEAQGEEWPDIVDMQLVPSGSSFRFDGLSPVTYSFHFHREGFIEQWRYIEFERGQRLDLGEIRLERAPLLTMSFVTRTRWEDSPWRTSSTLCTTNIYCDGLNRLHMTELQDRLGNDMGLFLKPNGDDVYASYFYEPGKGYFLYDLGNWEFDVGVDFHQLQERAHQEPAQSRLLLRRGHTYFFQSTQIYGLTIECVFAVE